MLVSAVRMHAPEGRDQDCLAHHSISSPQCDDWPREGIQQILSDEYMSTWPWTSSF